MDTLQPKEIAWHRINNDVNGNPRHVCHFLDVLTDSERFSSDLELGEKYELALKRARKLGGKKFHNKQYGGGIVFCTYNLDGLTRDINEALAKVNA